MKLNPFYIVGLFDGEGWFGVSLAEKKELTAGFQVSLNFGINMNSRELPLLYSIKEFFGCGTVEIRSNAMVQYRVRSFKDITTIIIPFFDKYKLQGGKISDFNYFKVIAKIMEEKKHITLDGVQAIRDIRKSLHVYNKVGEK